MQKLYIFLGKEIAGKITLKHVYEIAQVKHSDPALEVLPLEEICKRVIGIAKSCGIEVVKEVDPKEYGQFLEERKLIEEQQKRDLQEKKDAKMLRTG